MSFSNLFNSTKSSKCNLCRNVHLFAYQWLLFLKKYDLNLYFKFTNYVAFTQNLKIEKLHLFIEEREHHNFLVKKKTCLAGQK